MQDKIDQLTQAKPIAYGETSNTEDADSSSECEDGRSINTQVKEHTRGSNQLKMALITIPK
jgi:hypothetical protein